MKQLESLANNLNCRIDDLASTLLVVAVKSDKFIIVHIGDGVIGYLEEQELKIASKPENGEFINTTVFTTSNNALKRMKLIKGELGQIRGFLLMSDGTAESLYNKREKKIADIIKKVMNLCIYVPTEKIEEQLQQSFKYSISQVTMDDCSMVLMVNDFDKFNGYMKLSNKEKAKLLDIKTQNNQYKKRLERYDTMLSIMKEKKTVLSVSRTLHLKSKYTIRHLKKLNKLNLIEKKGNFYKTIIKM